MKFNKLMILGAAVSLSGMAQANITDKEFGPIEKSGAKQIATVAGEFGAYKLEPSLEMVPTAIASSSLVVAEKGNMSIVTANVASELTGIGSVVRNTLTNKLTTLTGNVTVLLHKDASAAELASQAGMEVVSVFPGTDIAIFRISEGNDLLEAFNSIKKSGLALESKVEVTDTIYEAL